MKKLVSIIIVNWNGKKNLADCLTALNKITFKSYEIIFVDNGSTDDSVRYVNSSFKNLKVIKEKINHGFAEGNNIGYKAAIGDYILFLNNDTIVPPDFLEPLVKDLEEDKNIAIVQPKVVFYRPGEVWHEKINSVGSFFTRYGFLNHVGFGKNAELPQYNKKMEILSAHGSCMLIKKDVIDKVGCFDPSYFAYFEETDLCFRVWLAGYKILYNPASFIYHKGAETSLKFQVEYMQYHSYKNRLYTLLKNLEFKSLLTVLPLHILFCEIATIAYLLIRKPAIAVAIQKAFLWNIINIRKIFKKRIEVQKLRTIKDSYFLPNLTRSFKLSYFYYMANGNLEKYREQDEGY